MLVHSSVFLSCKSASNLLRWCNQRSCQFLASPISRSGRNTFCTVTSALDSTVSPPATRVVRDRISCRRCFGAKKLVCQDCNGSGRLKRQGYNRNNTVNLGKIIGSKWTAMQRTLGWRHFRVTQKRMEKKEVYLCMVATCSPSTSIWVNAKNLKDRTGWAGGWLQKTELLHMEDVGGDCRACSGEGWRDCPLCSSGSVVVEL